MLDALYAECQPLIERECQKLARKTGHDIDDIRSAANFQFMYAFRNWDPEKAEFTTYLRWRLLGLQTHKANVRHTVEYEDRTKTDLTPYSYVSFKDRIDSLSEEAKEAVNMVLNLPAEMIEDITKPHHLRQHVSAEIKSKPGGWRRWARVRDEIREALQEA